MRKISQFVHKHKVAFGVFAFALVALSGSYGQVALAACPAVPADCTVDDVVGTSTDTIVDTTLATLVTNLPVIVIGAVAIMIGFALIRLSMRWVKKFIK